PTVAGHQAVARRLIEGGSDIVRWNSVRRSASARYVARRIRDRTGGRVPPPAPAPRAVPRRLIGGGSDIVGWNSVRRPASPRYVARRIRDRTGGRVPPSASAFGPSSASPMYVHPSSAVRAKCRGRGADQLI